VAPMDQSSPRPRTNLDAQRLLGTGVAVYLLLGVTLVVIGRGADAGALIAEGWHTVGDGLLGLLLVAASRLSARGVDAEHPYGREKFEHLGAAILGGVLLVFAGEAVFDLVGHATSGVPHQPDLGPQGTAIVVAVPLVRGAWVGVLLILARRLDSVAVQVEARHASVDAIVTTLAATAAIGGQWVPWVDALAAIAVVLMVAKMGSALVREHAPWLADRAVLSEQQIAVALQPFEAVVPQRVRSRGTPRAVFVDVVLGLPCSASVREAAVLIEAVTAALRTAFPNIVDVLVQIAPIAQGPPTVSHACTAS
jgi:cation diffusion facilitator family transporter